MNLNCQVKMKLLVLILVAMVVISSCMAVPRRDVLGGIYGQEQRHRVDKGKSIEAVKGRVGLQKKSIDNHHNIPRQNYDDRGTGKGDAAGDSSDNGSG